ncbi:MAG TPA: hypothetical protein VEV87_06590 [Chitinophagaceae bacterium]|nr:hypothetical protein [Chitinophagaceae bacterium]
MNGWTTSISASPGLSFALNKRFHLESAFYNLFYFAYTQKQTDLTNNLGKATYDSHSIGGGVILENVSYFNLGFRFLLNK